MNGFDSIINTLDKHLEPKPYVSPSDPFPPDVQATKDNKPHPKDEPYFKRGDVLVMRETRWPPENGKILNKTGLYAKPGFPRLQDLRYPQSSEDSEGFNSELYYALREELVGNVQIGDIVTVRDILRLKDEARFYYCLEKRTTLERGWTRCSFRFKLLDR